MHPMYFLAWMASLCTCAGFVCFLVYPAWRLSLVIALAIAVVLWPFICWWVAKVTVRDNEWEEDFERRKQELEERRKQYNQRLKKYQERKRKEM